MYDTNVRLRPPVAKAPVAGNARGTTKAQMARYIAQSPRRSTSNAGSGQSAQRYVRRRSY